MVRFLKETNHWQYRQIWQSGFLNPKCTQKKNNFYVHKPQHFLEGFTWHSRCIKGCSCWNFFFIIFFCHIKHFSINFSYQTFHFSILAVFISATLNNNSSTFHLSSLKLTLKIATQTELILYQGQNYTVIALIKELQHYGTPIDQYNAQVKIQDYLLHCQIKQDMRIKKFYQYVLADGMCWRVGKNLEDEKWKKTGKIAKKNKKRKKRFETTMASILADWGEQAEKLIKDKLYTVMSKIQFLAKQVKFIIAWILFNNVIFTQIKKTKETNR